MFIFGRGCVDEMKFKNVKVDGDFGIWIDGVIEVCVFNEIGFIV